MCLHPVTACRGVVSSKNVRDSLKSPCCLDSPIVTVRFESGLYRTADKRIHRYPVPHRGQLAALHKPSGVLWDGRVATEHHEFKVFVAQGFEDALCGGVGRR